MYMSQFLSLFQAHEPVELREMELEQLRQVVRTAISMALQLQKNECLYHMICWMLITYVNGASYTHKVLDTGLVGLL